MILIVEFGVALAVMAILVAIFDQLMERTGND
jgi:preprotein translocase subunit SecE